jgi:hypothetical protein
MCLCAKVIDFDSFYDTCIVSCFCVLRVSILTLSMILVLQFVSAVRYFFLSFCYSCGSNYKERMVGITLTGVTFSVCYQARV